MGNPVIETETNEHSSTQSKRWRWPVAIAATVVVLAVLIGVSVGLYSTGTDANQVADNQGIEAIATDIIGVESTASIEQEKQQTAMEGEIVPQAPTYPNGTDQGQDDPAIVQEDVFLSYDFSVAAPEGEAMGQEWFSDAVFIGDSRTEGLSLYSGILGSTFLCCKGISIFDVLEDEDKIIFRDGTYYTILEALTLGSYSKVYISLGINELGYNNDQAYEDAFVELIAQVRAIQPDAVIYIQTIVPVNPDRALERGQADYVNNNRIADYNAILRKVTAQEQVVLLETAIALADEEGILPYDATSDGVHFVRAWYELWRDYLLNHTVDAQLYFESQT